MAQDALDGEAVLADQPEAMAYYEQALQVRAHLPEGSDTRVLAIDLRLALGGARNALGEYAWHRALLGEAEALAGVWSGYV